LHRCGASPRYPPPGTYTFRHSLSSSAGDCKSSKAYRAGLNWNNPLLAAEVVDEISSKTLPPSQSFCSLQADNVVISALKKSDLDSGVRQRTYEIEGAPVDTSVQFLGRSRAFREVNLLEESKGSMQQQLQVGPFAICMIKFNVPKAE
jgi:alpha-mannosidase